MLICYYVRLWHIILYCLICIVIIIVIIIIRLLFDHADLNNSGLVTRDDLVSLLQTSSVKSADTSTSPRMSGVLDRSSLSTYSNCGLMMRRGTGAKMADVTTAL